MRINRKLTLVAPDIHFGEHDELAVDLFLKTVEMTRPWRVVQLGDMLDAAPFSSHMAHKMRLLRDYDFVGREVAPARKWIQKVLRWSSYFHLLEGNHEYRAERWCLTAGMAGEAVWDLIDPKTVILGSFEKSHVGYTPFIADRDVTSRYHIARDLIAVHGWSAAKHAASVHLQKASIGGWSVIYGHTHRNQNDSLRNPANDKLMKAWSPGCLRTFRPQYTQGNGPTAWAHGFDMIYVGRRSWTNYTITINRGEVVTPDGRQVRV